MDAHVAGRLMALEATVLYLAQQLPSDDARIDARRVITDYIENSYRGGTTDHDHQARQIALEWVGGLLHPRQPQRPVPDAT